MATVVLILGREEEEFDVGKSDSTVFAVSTDKIKYSLQLTYDCLLSLWSKFGGGAVGTT